MKRAFQILLWLLTVLVIVIIVRTLLFSSMQMRTEAIKIDGIAENAIEHLSQAVAFPTVSYNAGSPVDTITFRSYMEFIRLTYPLVHKNLELKIFNSFSMLYRWAGNDTSLRPMVLMAHYDVVPPGDSSSWDEQPFSGYNDGTYIWGRGTLDDKAAMISILEAVEQLLKSGYKPERTLYLSFGHDEELLGSRGAGSIAGEFIKLGIRPEYILDEGMAISLGMVPMIDKPVALIGTSEKGYLTVKMIVQMPGGHSSTPEKESAVSVMTNAIAKLMARQMDPELSGPVNDFIRYIGPEMPFYAKAVFANLWLFSGILFNIYTGSASGNAMVRTTTAPTMINAGIKDNMIPTRAEATLNFRILPGETCSDVISHIKKVIADEKFIIEPDSTTMCEPAPVSPVDALGFRNISATIRQLYPDAIVAPTLMLGSSDSRYFSAVTPYIYRFAPIMVTTADMARIHGLNERIKAEDFRKGIRFYYQLIINSQGR